MAVTAYIFMGLSWLEHLIFTFPELLLVILALVLLAGTGFHVDGDFDGYCDDLKAKGVKFTMDPVNINPNLRIAFIEAPDGESIELLQQKS